MALATQCPHCHTKFRVAADQLKLRGGIVRCGACQSIFDGNAHLVDLDAPGRKDAAPAESAESAESAPSSLTVTSALPVETLDDTAPDFPDVPSDVPFDTPPDPPPAPAAEVPQDIADGGVPAPEPEPEPASMPHDPSGRIEPSFGLPPQPVPGQAATPDADERGDAQTGGAPSALPSSGRSAVRDDIPFTALPLRASAVGAPSLAGPVSGLPAAAAGSKRARALDARTRRSKLTPTRIDAPKLRVPDSDEPEFVKRSRRQERSGRTQRILMAVGAAVLLLALATQALLMGRDVLAARYPAAKPLLGALCGAFGCRVGLPTQIENLAIETGELSPLGPGTYSLNTLLRNQGTLVQTWPSIELELVDDDNKPLLRRVFGPADYLPPAQTAGMQAAGFAARSEQPVRIDFALAGLSPAGYHLFVFYP